MSFYGLAVGVLVIPPNPLAHFPPRQQNKNKQIALAIQFDTLKHPANIESMRRMCNIKKRKGKPLKNSLSRKDPMGQTKC